MSFTESGASELIFRFGRCGRRFSHQRLLMTRRTIVAVISSY
jgi:hypothetical protein